MSSSFFDKFTAIELMEFGLKPSSRDALLNTVDIKSQRKRSVENNLEYTLCRVIEIRAAVGLLITSL